MLIGCDSGQLSRGAGEEARGSVVEGRKEGGEQRGEVARCVFDFFKITKPRGILVKLQTGYASTVRSFWCVAPPPHRLAPMNAAHAAQELLEELVRRFMQPP